MSTFDFIFVVDSGDGYKADSSSPEPLEAEKSTVSSGSGTLLVNPATVSKNAIHQIVTLLWSNYSLSSKNV